MALRTTSDTILASVIGFVVLLFTASTMFFQLQFALNTIWKIPANKSRATRDFIRGRLMAFVMLLGVILVLILSATISLLFSFVQRVIDIPILLQVLNFAAFAGLITLSCALIFKVLPNAKVAWRDVWVGALTFGLPITIGLALIGTIITSNRFSISSGSSLFLVRSLREYMQTSMEPGFHPMSLEFSIENNPGIVFPLRFSVEAASRRYHMEIKLISMLSSSKVLT